MPRKKTTVTVRNEFDTGVFFIGLFLVGIGIFFLFSFVTADVTLDPQNAAAECATGLFGAWAAYGVILTLGKGAAYFFALLLIAWGVQVAREQQFWATWPQVLGGMVMLVAISILMALLSRGCGLLGCGLLAYALAPPAEAYLGSTGCVITMAALLIFGAIISFGHTALTALAMAGRMPWLLLRLAPSAAVVSLHRLRPAPAPRQDRDEDNAHHPLPEAHLPASEPAPAAVEPNPTPLAPPSATTTSSSAPEKPGGDKASVAARDFVPYGEESESAVSVAEPPPLAVVPRRPERPRHQAVERYSASESGEYQLPPFDLLDRAEDRVREGAGNIKRRGEVLEKTLAEFRIDGRVVEVEIGPRVTLFEIALAPGIHVNRVVNLANNIAMALKAPNVRIIAPIPGKDTIGIEIPNVEKEIVTLREIAEARRGQDRREILPVCLGKDIAGNPVIGDLTKMPHLLIAGATGSGKSVCINSIIVSMLMFCRPDEVKMILIDPKVVELSRFKDIPHLMSPVITNMQRAVEVMEWACQKMDERYEQLNLVNVNNIAKFNALGAREIENRLAGIYAPDELDLFPKKLPYILIIIDELADLMLVAKKDVEAHVARLAAKSRAVGIHVILATQRPSVDVITGLIKANLPCRIAFQVASKVDSRTILDQNGAETLLGAGDMLYLPPGVGKMMRVQGVFVSDEEVQRVADFCRRQRKPEYHADLEQAASGASAAGGNLEEYDDLFYECGIAIIESGRGSVSLLQRKFGIGYGRASRIIDQLAAAGVLGPFREGKAREILLTIEEFQSRFGSAASKGVAGVFGSLTGVRDDEEEPPPTDRE